MRCLLFGWMLLLMWGCTETPEVNPRAAEFIVQAQDAFERGNATVALALTDSAAWYGSEQPELYFLIGRIYTELRDFAKAEEAYRIVLALDSEAEGVWLNLGNNAFRQAQPRQALAFYKREQDVHTSATAALQIGRAYAELGEADSARWAYEQAIDLDDTKATAYMRLGQIHKEQGELEKALAISQQGLELEPDNLNYQFVMGSLHNLNGEPEKAVTYLQPVVEAWPWHYWAHHNMSQALRRLGREGEADDYQARAERLQGTLEELERWQTMAEMNPDQFMIWVRYAVALRHADRPDEAERVERVVYALTPRYVSHHFEDERVLERHRQAMAHLTDGDVSAALDIYRAELREDPNQPNLWLNLGVAYAAHGRIEQAQRSWDVVLRLLPGHETALQYQADVKDAFGIEGEGTGQLPVPTPSSSSS